MSTELLKLQKAQQKTEVAAKKTNKKINELGKYAGTLYSFLNEIQKVFNRIRNVSEEKRQKYEELKAISVHWKQQVEKIETEYKKTEMKTVGQGAAGIGAGMAVAALGPTAAMGIATTFGVASTGTAISTLGGAAATNAALAWLGGGALAAGGGGMAAGSAFLALAGPVGWAVAGLAFVTSGILFLRSKHNKERLENIYTLISERDTKSYNLAIAEIGERIKRIEDESHKLSDAITKIKTFGTDYGRMTESQQFELGSYVNLMESATMLLVNPILGLQPKYTEQDFEKMCALESDSGFDWSWVKEYCRQHKKMVISLSNLLYKIELDDEDRKVLAKSLRKNEKFLELIDMDKDEFDDSDIDTVERVLDVKYKLKNNSVSN